ncbi:VOC family protein [Croceicoccus naphthovorans]|uniref:Glyoxalase n=1 Tax=Croceicoccus naphthovorans TaxID=1348774 RepID=A0A0G3XHX2_9SPHN|nr:VOC family protein [Croceicoccus naphthovorans]AKM10199.1 glyoxalase [Croceicoccus naphthovorans]MBB3990552.1 catechol 2,3-dioxygenase-like lactoylglutathione lyase family enzyme [Croceicoccus naphthovorans]
MDGKVLGMGGLFFRAKAPEALAAWYRDHLSVGAGCGNGGDAAGAEWFWHPQAGPMVFAPFPADSDYFAADKAFMLNFRVSGLEALVARLEVSGIVAERRADWDSPETGRFARIHDPEGNAIELWEPPAD